MDENNNIFSLEKSIQFLNSISNKDMDWGEESRKKWDGAWWHMATLYEMGEVKKIPFSAINLAKNLLKNKVWPVFIISDSDLPVSKKDQEKWDCCHCELAVYYMILSAYGCDLDEELPWIRKWFLNHQLPDGGLNCNPDAYLHSHKSSIVSTLPPLEAILLYTDREFTEQEATFLDEGARYLIEHRLICSEKGQVINKEWTKPCFPRFFEYDLLRGMSYLVNWSKLRGKPLPSDILNEGLLKLNLFKNSKGLRIGRQVFDPQGEWGGRTFELLEEVSVVGNVSPYLTEEFERVRKRTKFVG